MVFGIGELAVVAVLFGAVAVALNHFSRKRIDERDRRLAAFAAQRGWTYRRVDPALATRWTGPPFARRGTATQVLSGSLDGRDFTAFAYTWTEGSGKNEVTHRHMVAAIALPAVLPLLWISPQTVRHRLSNPLGSHDIDFESTQFNDSFMVTADDDRYAYAVVHPRMMDFLLGSSARNQPIRIEGNHALTWIDAEFGPEEAVAAASLLAEFVNRIPDHVYEQYATSAATGYAGSVSGLRPEATGTDLAKTAFVLLWGIVWLGISGGMAYGAFRAMTFTTVEWYWLAMPVGFVAIGLAVVLGTVVRLVRGGLAIHWNRRERRRRQGWVRPL